MNKFIKETAVEAGDAILKLFGKIGVAYTKEDLGDVVTKADLLSEKIIIKAIKKRFPDHCIISEETPGNYQTGEYTWYIDPLDGTRNFATGVPLFGAMIALAHRGEIINSAIYLPCMKELYHAEKGKGATLNGKKIKCSDNQNLVHSYGLGTARMSEKNSEVINKIFMATKGKLAMNTLGSIAVASCWVASGKRDWYITSRGKCWDYAASCLIMKEAGCMITSIRGEKWNLECNEVLAANKKMHRKLLKVLN